MSSDSGTTVVLRTSGGTNNRLATQVQLCIMRTNGGADKRLATQVRTCMSRTYPNTYLDVSV